MREGPLVTRHSLPAKHLPHCLAWLYLPSKFLRRVEGMGTLYLVRHGQASFLQDNYDNLSPLGEQQSRLLGQHWYQRKIKFHRVATGPCVRQKDTAKIIAASYRHAGLPFPDPQEFPEFDEYQAEAVLKRLLPQLLESDQAIADLHATFKSSAANAEQRKNFQKLFETVVGHWVSGKSPVEGVETWQEFKTRVNSGINKFLTASQRGERVAIFTSGGPIAIAMQRALNLSDEATLGASWMSQNSSWSEFLYGANANRFTLSTFNTHPHIEDPAMLTYR
jgi:broad specificity phosphatase PhoE